MKAILICPSPRLEVELLSESEPLAAAPLLGESLLEYWLSYLACAGATQATIVAHDRPEHIDFFVSKGLRWGFEVAVVTETRELTPEEALLKYATELPEGESQNITALLDHLPGMPEQPLLGSYSDWFAGLCRWMPKALTPDRVGMHEAQPGVWVGVRSHISPGAQLNAPCWIGNHVWVGPEAVIGPQTVVENGAVVDCGAELVNSCVGRGTFVGQFAQITDSFAWGSNLVNWQTGVAARVTEPFLLCALRHHRAQRAHGLLTRLAELCSHQGEEVAPIWKHLLLQRHG